MTLRHAASVALLTAVGGVPVAGIGDARPARAAEAAGVRPSIAVVYPPEGAAIPAVESTFIFGSVQPPSAPLSINGVPVAVHRTGGFLAFLPVQTGEFAFVLTAGAGADTTTLVRSVTVAAARAALPRSHVAIDTASVEPAEDVGVLPGDVVTVRARASPGSAVWFELGGRRVPMPAGMSAAAADQGAAAFGGAADQPDTTAGDSYAGGYVVQPSDSMRGARIAVVAASATETVRVVSRGAVTVLDPRLTRAAVFADSLTIGRSGPGAGYVLFIPRGARASLTGSRGSWVRLGVAEDLDVWAPRASVRVLPEGAPPPRPRIGTLHVDERAHAAEITVTVTPPVPYRIDEETDPARLVVTIYGATADVDWMRYDRPRRAEDGSEPYVREIRWRQAANGAVQLIALLNGRRAWGYQAGYIGRTFRIAAMRPPAPARGGLLHHGGPLSGLVIALDAGHSPDTGATGPTGYLERDATLAISHALGRRLADRGARIVYTRPDTAGVALGQRPRIAVQSGAHLLVSVHLNSLPPGVNPFLHHGTSVYYYYPHSLPLAEEVHAALLERLHQPDFGLFYGNLALVRPTEMPAILTESTFLILPAEEEKVRTKEGARAIADAIAEGVERFVRRGGWR